MKPNNSLAILCELAEEARNKAAQLLAGERQSQAQLQSQLNTLCEYRVEYMARLNECMDQGIDAVALQDYWRFLDSLDRAIENAKQSLQVQAKRVTSRQEDWQVEQRRLMSFNTLASRRSAQIQKAEQRKEMRQQDEIASNLFLRAKQPLIVNE